MIYYISVPVFVLRDTLTDIIH